MPFYLFRLACDQARPPVSSGVDRLSEFSIRQTSRTIFSLSDPEGSTEAAQTQ